MRRGTTKSRMIFCTVSACINLLAIMYSVAIVGHSLSPVSMGEISGVSVQNYCKLGGKWEDYHCKEFRV